MVLGRIVRLATLVGALFGIFGAIITFLGWLYPPSQSKEAVTPPSPPLVQAAAPIVHVHNRVVVVERPQPAPSVQPNYHATVAETPSRTVVVREAPPEPPRKQEVAVNAHTIVPPQPSLSDSSLRLLHASRAGRRHDVKQWLAYRADPNAAGDDGKTALMFAAQGGHHDISRELIRAGARLTQKDVRGRSALHYAAEGGNNDVVQLLLDHGSAPELIDNEGNTALALALRGGHDTSAKVIRKAMMSLIR